MRIPSKALACVAVLSLAATACAGQAPDREAAGLEKSGSAGDSVSLRLGHVYDPEHPNETCGTESVAKKLDDGGSGITVASHPAGQLGTEEELLEQVANGSLELSIAGPSFLAAYHEPAGVLDAAYAFQDVDHFERTVNGEIGAKIWRGLREEAGLRVLGTWYYGARHVTANKPVRAPEDLAGLKLRAPNNPINIANTKAMGGTAAPMALGEVYLGLQQGVIDGQENPIPTIETNKFAEVQKSVSLTGHVFQGTAVVIGEETFQGLEPAQQKALTDAVAEAGDRVRKCIEDDEQKTLSEWRDSGAIEVVDDVDVNAFADRANRQLPGMFSWGELYRRIRAEG